MEVQLHSFQAPLLDLVSGQPHVPTPLTPRERARLTHDAGGPWLQKIWANLLFFPCMLHATPISSDHQAPRGAVYKPFTCPFFVILSSFLPLAPTAFVVPVHQVPHPYNRAVTAASRPFYVLTRHKTFAAGHSPHFSE